MKVTAIIPAYEEEKTVASVIKAVQGCPQVSEVIVVNDGSSDRTGVVAGETGARVINLPSNTGKGGAIKAGYDSTEADCLLLLDADLIGLTPEHIRALLEPVLQGQVEMTIGVFGNGRLLTDLAQKLAPQLSGQRGVRREVIGAIESLETMRFGVEMALTQSAKAVGFRSQTVLLPNLSHVMKEEKLGFFPGFKARLQMYWDIIRYRRDHRGVGD